MSSPHCRWNLRQVMAGRGLYKTSELAPLLAGRGVVLSSAQVYRLVTSAPLRLSLETLAALCDILSCTPNDLIELTDATQSEASTRPPLEKVRPRRARVVAS
ncbi:MAG TPA: XRE family transcriptional regulator [Acidimicrobiaceae bacterium]|nr:XRE family transcriptional regulator [Acidimicrobiaceae bacterium]